MDARTLRIFLGFLFLSFVIYRYWTMLDEEFTQTHNQAPEKSIQIVVPPAKQQPPNEESGNQDQQSNGHVNSVYRGASLRDFNLPLSDSPEEHAPAQQTPPPTSDSTTKRCCSFLRSLFDKKHRKRTLASLVAGICAGFVNGSLSTGKNLVVLLSLRSIKN